jgi:hypothetical protein
MPDSVTLPPIAQRVGYFTLIAAMAVGVGQHAEAKRREACKQIFAQVYRVVVAGLRPDAPDVRRKGCRDGCLGARFSEGDAGIMPT